MACCLLYSPKTRCAKILCQTNDCIQYPTAILTHNYQYTVELLQNTYSQICLINPTPVNLKMVFSFVVSGTPVHIAFTPHSTCNHRDYAHLLRTGKSLAEHDTVVILRHTTKDIQEWLSLILNKRRVYCHEYDCIVWASEWTTVFNVDKPVDILGNIHIFDNYTQCPELTLSNILQLTHIRPRDFARCVYPLNAMYRNPFLLWNLQEYCSVVRLPEHGIDIPLRHKSTIRSVRRWCRELRQSRIYSVNPRVYTHIIGLGSSPRLIDLLGFAKHFPPLDFKLEPSCYFDFIRKFRTLRHYNWPALFNATIYYGVKLNMRTINILAFAAVVPSAPLLRTDEKFETWYWRLYDWTAKFVPMHPYVMSSCLQDIMEVSAQRLNFFTATLRKFLWCLRHNEHARKLLVMPTEKYNFITAYGCRPWPGLFFPRLNEIKE